MVGLVDDGWRVGGWVGSCVGVPVGCTLEGSSDGWAVGLAVVGFVGLIEATYTPVTSAVKTASFRFPVGVSIAK